MTNDKLTLMEMAIMDAARQGMIERTDIGAHARTIVSDYDAAGPTLWTQETVIQFADTLEGLTDKGYLAWKNYLLQLELTEKGRKFVADNLAELDSLPKVEDDKEWFKEQRKKMAL
jgi:hypothetical protein